MVTHITYLDKISSTNDYVVEIVKNGFSNQGIVLCDKQFKGRGRRGKVWQSLEGNIFCSIYATFLIVCSIPKNPGTISRKPGESRSRDCKFRPYIANPNLHLRITQKPPPPSEWSLAYRSKSGEGDF